MTEAEYVEVDISKMSERERALELKRLVEEGDLCSDYFFAIVLSLPQGYKGVLGDSLRAHPQKRNQFG